MSERNNLSGRVIAFEGVDGAGKSTVIGLVAAHLQARGVAVTRPRIGKEHISKPIREIRRLTRDRTNLDLCPRAELLLYAARETQVIEQHVRPAVAAGKTVLLDRSMLTPVVLGSHGRGLDLGESEALAALAEGGVRADHTLIFDVEARTSRIRKRLDKIRNPERDAGRKGLAGSAFKERIRDGYLEIAARDHLPVFHAERGTPQDVAARVIAYLETGHFEETAADATPWWIVEPGQSFLDVLDGLPPTLQIYFTRRMAIGRELRARLLEVEPALVIWAADLDDPVLERARELAPDRVLARLARSEQAQPLREQLLTSHPEAVGRSLTLVAGEAADAMRERLAELAPGAAVESLMGRSDPFAVALRKRLWKQADVYERAHSLQGCDDPESWALRERVIEKDPAVAVAALAGIAGDRVDAILEQYRDRAPKSVIRALKGRSDPKAHALRLQLLESGREVIDSLYGLDDADSWALRERCAERWPASVLRSLEGLAPSSRIPPLVDRCRAAAPTDLFLLRRLHRLDSPEGFDGAD